MIQKIFVVFGLVLFINQLFKKLDVWDWIEFQGSKSNFETIFNLSKCRFCLLFHVSWIVTIIYGAFSSFSWDLAVVPFVVGGLTQIIKEDDV